MGGARISSGSDSKQDYKTQSDLMAAITGRFGPITFDLAALAANAQSPNYFAPCTGPEGPLPFDPKAYGIDAFDHDWAKISTNTHRRDGFIGLSWLNCEFNDIATWAERCYREAQRGANILLLTPASVGANWFSELIAPYADTYLLKPRLSFIPKQTYNKDCMLSHFVSTEVRNTGKFAVVGAPEGNVRSLEIWNWKKNKIEQQWTRPNQLAA